MSMFDLVVANGTIVDPDVSESYAADIGIRGGRVVAVGALAGADARQVLDASGHIVTPGLIDGHVHLYAGVTWMGAPVESVSFASGVTTLVDAGSAGADTFGGFRRLVSDPSAARIFCLLNASRIGLSGTQSVGEVENRRYLDWDATREILRRHPAVAKGVKLRVSRPATGGPCLDVLAEAVSVTRELGVPLCVHMADSADPVDEVLALLGAGDIVTHYQTRRASGLLDDSGAVLESAFDARRRGILFDVGHGGTHFDFAVAQTLLDAGLGPDLISTDISLHSLNELQPGLVTVINKWLCLGLPLIDAIRASTSAPADALVPGSGLGRLSVGSVGDLAIFRIESGRFEWQDCGGASRTGNERLVPVATVLGGGVVWGGGSGLVSVG